jgi:hypothetical protein
MSLCIFVIIYEQRGVIIIMSLCVLVKFVTSSLVHVEFEINIIKFRQPYRQDFDAPAITFLSLGPFRAGYWNSVGCDLYHVGSLKKKINYRTNIVCTISVLNIFWEI